jgi:hypothetical protein
MSEVLLCVDLHHLAQPLIVDLMHLLHQWTYTKVSASIYEPYNIHESLGNLIGKVLQLFVKRKGLSSLMLY